MPFGLKNATAIFFRIVFASFKDYIQKIIEAYFDDWIAFGSMKYDIESLRMMLERCFQYQISLNLWKCTFCAPFGALLGHVVYHDGILVNPAKISIIMDLPPSTIVKQLTPTLGHTGYYRNFIKGYAQVTAPMEKLLTKYTKF